MSLKNKNHSLQILRVVAAIMVVLAHLISRLVKYNLVDPQWEEIARMGAKGVDIFFVISGFIVGATFLNTAVGPRQSMVFFKRRFFRIAPSYYFWSILMAAKLVLVDKTTMSVLMILTSATFIPHYNAEVGHIQPIYSLGWSLNFEMYFYAILAIALLIPKKGFAVLFVYATIAAPIVVYSISYSSGQEMSTTLAFYGMPVALFFLFGLALSLMKKKFSSIFAFRSISLNVLVSVAFSVLAVAFTQQLAIFFTCACVSVAALENDSSEPPPMILFGSFLGDASYSIYLTHSFVLGPFVALYRAMVKTDSTIGVISLIFFSVIGCIIVGALAYLYIEKKLTIFFIRKFFVPSLKSV